MRMPLSQQTQAAQDAQAPARDLAAQGGYSIRKLERLLQDCEEQPLWRSRSDLCMAYVDGNQLSAQQQRTAIQNGLVPRVINLIGRTYRGVLGQEAKNRRDMTVEPDDDQWADVCDVLSVKLKEAQRETHADMAISNGYGSQVGAGVGWVEVSRVSDPMEYPYRVQDVHRNEIWWDWRAKRIDLSDARWLCRRRWIDLDEAQAMFPEFADVLEQAQTNFAPILMDDWTDSERITNAFSDARSFSVPRSEWYDSVRRRVKFYEVWYRVPMQVVMMRVGPKAVQFNQANPHHVEAVSRGLVQLERRVTSQVRCALYAGPFRLVDQPTQRRRFPYIPFFAFRDDGTNSPYGLVDGMIDPQDEYNERRLRIQWLLKAQQIVVEEDALADEYNNLTDLAQDAMRPDMVIVLNKARLNKSSEAVRIGNAMSLQSEQFEIMQDSKQLVQDVPGVYSAQLGNAPAGVTSGLAINSLVEQGLVAMGDLNDNYALARTAVFEALLELVREDLSAPNTPIPIGAGQTRRVVVLNTFAPKMAPVADPQTGQPAVGPDGQPAMQPVMGPHGQPVPDQTQPINMVKDAAVHTGLAEAPASPAYQMQVSQQMRDVITALAGSPAQAVVLPAWVENTQAFGPGRKQMADDMRRMAGLPVAGDRSGAQAWQQQQMQRAAQQQAEQAATAQAQRQQLVASAQHEAAKGVLDAADANLSQAKATKINLDVAHQFHTGIPVPPGDNPQLAAADQAPQGPTEDDLIQQSLAQAA